MAADGPDASAGTTTMTRESPQAAPAAATVRRVPRAPRLRRWLVLALVVLASLGAVSSGVAWWLHQTLLDTDTWVATVAPIADDPEVKQAVADYVGQQVVTALDLERRTAEALPPRLQFLAAPLTQTVREFITDETRRFVDSDAARRLWVGANRFAHQQIVSILRGENESVVLEGDQVDLNLLPLINEVLKLVDRALPDLLGRDVQIPEITSGVLPKEARQAISEAIGRPVPADFGAVPLFKSKELQTAQRAVETFDRVVVALIVVTVLLAAAAIALSVHRRRTLLQLGVGALVAVLVVRVGARLLERSLVDSFGPGAAGGVARATLGSVVDSLNGTVLPLLLVGVAVAVAAYLAGRPVWVTTGAVAVAEATVRGARAAEVSRTADGWAARHLDGLRLAGVVTAGVLLLLVPLSGWMVLVVLAALVAYLVALAWVTLTWPFAGAKTAEATGHDAARGEDGGDDHPG